MANSENSTQPASHLISLVSKSIVPIFILLVTFATIAYTWSIQQSCDPLIAVKIADRCYIANVSIDFQRLPWQNTEPLVLKVREEKQLNAKVGLVKGSPAIAPVVSWQSTRPKIVSIDPTGKLVALQPGVAEIRARAKLNSQKVGILKVEVLTDVSKVSASSDPVTPTKTLPSESIREQEPPVKVNPVDRFKTQVKRILPNTKQPKTDFKSEELVEPTKPLPSESIREQEPPVKINPVDRLKTQFKRILPNTKQPETGSSSSEQSQT